MENAPLKSSKEVSMEKVKSAEEARERKPLKTAKEIAMEKTKRLSMEADDEKESIEKMKKIAVEQGIDVSESIKGKQSQIEELKTRMERMTTQAMGDFITYMKTGKRPESHEVKDEVEEEKKEKKNPAITQAMNDFIKYMKNGERPKSHEVEIEDDLEEFSQKLELVTNPNDLLDLMNTIDGLEGTGGYMRARDQKEHIKKLFEEKNEKHLKDITRSCGLRKNVKRVYDLMQKGKESFKKAA